MRSSLPKTDSNNSPRFGDKFLVGPSARPHASSEGEKAHMLLEREKVHMLLESDREGRGKGKKILASFIDNVVCSVMVPYVCLFLFWFPDIWPNDGFSQRAKGGGRSFLLEEYGGRKNLGGKHPCSGSNSLSSMVETPACLLLHGYCPSHIMSQNRIEMRNGVRLGN